MSNKIERRRLPDNFKRQVKVRAGVHLCAQHVQTTKSPPPDRRTLARVADRFNNNRQLAERINSLRKQYDAFLEEDKKRKERNDYILGRLDNMRAATVALRIRYNNLKPIDAPQSKHDTVPNNFLQVTPLRNSTLTQLNEETDENTILKEINKRFILIPRNSSLLNQNLTHPKEKVDDVDWTSKYNILDQLKQSELEIEVTKENELTKNINENKKCNKKISFEESTDDEKDIDTSLSENICEREDYENKANVNSYALKNSLAHGITSDDNNKNIGIGDNASANGTNYDNSRLEHNQLKNTAHNELESMKDNQILNISPNNNNKLQIETQNLIQTEANILADGIIKSLQESNTEKFDPGIQNGQHLLEKESNDINYTSDSPVIKHNTQPETQDSPIKDTQDGYYTQQPGIVQDSKILDRNYEKQTEEETQAGTQNPDYEEQNIVADTNYYNEENLNQPDEYQTEQLNQNYEENMVTDTTYYDENTVQQAELYPTDQLNQNYEEENIVTENNYYNQNNQQSDQHEHHLAEEQNQNYGDNNIVPENNYYDDNNQQPVDQYEQLGEQQNPNYDEQQIAAENNYYDENNQQEVEQYDQLGEQQNSNYDEQPIVAENNYYDELNQQQAGLQQQYAEEPTPNYNEQNIVSENVYYDENGQQQTNQLAEQPTSNYDEQPAAVENNYYDESNQQYSTEQPNDNYNEQYDENYQQQFNNDQGPYEESHQNEETVILSNEQVTQG